MSLPTIVSIKKIYMMVMMMMMIHDNIVIYTIGTFIFYI